MAKTKTSGRRAFHASNSQKVKANPFEIRVNKVKHNVLGRRVCKNEVGKPFESRNKAFKKRKSTLFGEYKRKDKRGKGVVDRRLKDATTTGVVLRKTSVWKMKNAMNSDGESLTHKGINLSDINLKESYSDLEDDENELDLLRRGDYVESAHFGGGDSGAAKSAKEFMDEIFDEKRRKQVEKEANVELTEKLDKDWLNVKNLLQHKGAKFQSTESTNDDYDVLVKQLAFSDNQQKAKLEITNRAEQNDSGKHPMGKNQQFLEKVNEMLSSNDVNNVSSILESLSDFHKLNFETIDIMKSVIREFRHISLRSISLLLLCSRISALKDCCYVKSIQLLRNTKLNSIVNIVKCMCLIQLLMNIGDSFYPEVIQTLQNILVLCLGEKFVDFFTPSFDVTRMKQKDILVVRNCCSIDVEPLDLDFKHIFDSSVTFTDSDHSKMSVMKALLQLISTVAHKYKNLVSFSEVFNNISTLIDNLYKSDSSQLFSLDPLRESLGRKIEKGYLFREKRKPLMLPLYEPRIESSKRQESNKKLVKKYKREFKGAQRELKKDTAFLKDVWLKETLKKDKQRKQKVKQLYAELATEASLYKKKK